MVGFRVEPALLSTVVCLALTDARDPTSVKAPRRGDSEALLPIHLPIGLSMSPGFCSLSVPVSSLVAVPLGTCIRVFLESHLV